MASFLRVTRQARWLKYPDISWLPRNEIQGDTLRDLQTDDNSLSVFRVESDQDTERVVTALAANRDNLANLDYAVFDDATLKSIGVNVAQRSGETPDREVNKLHYNLTNLTVTRLARLAAVVAAGQHERTPRKMIKGRLQRAVNKGSLDRHRLKSQLLQKLK